MGAYARLLQDQWVNRLTYLPPVPVTAASHSAPHHLCDLCEDPQAPGVLCGLLEMPLFFFFDRKPCKVNNTRELNIPLQNLAEIHLLHLSAFGFTVSVKGGIQKKNLFPVCPFFRLRSRVAQNGFSAFRRSTFAAFIEPS